LRKKYSELKGWYLNDQVIKVYQIYQTVLKNLSSKVHILGRCSQCHIEFITTQSNQGRNDLRCPFGCRQIHKKNESNKRSTAYYKTPEGKNKKKVQNNKRKKNVTCSEENESLSPSLSTTVLYIQLVLTAIYKKSLSILAINKLVEMVRIELRQHGLEKIIKSIIVTGYE
jgi:hypothetical protein